jgi:hypothetical protein
MLSKKTAERLGERQTCAGNTAKAKVSNDFGFTAYCPTVQCEVAPALTCLKMTKIKYLQIPINLT